MDLDDVLTELVAQSGDRLLRVGYQLTHDRMAAQDLVQDALMRIYGSVSRCGGTPEDWYAYVRCAVINEYVRTRRLRSSTEVMMDRGALSRLNPAILHALLPHLSGALPRPCHQE